MKTKPETVLTLMHVFAYIAMIGYAIEAGSKIISAIVSFGNEIATKNIYKGLDLSLIRAYDIRYYGMALSLVIAIPILKAHIWYKVIGILKDFDLSNPFKIDIAKKMENIVADLLGIIITLFISNIWFEWLTKRIPELQKIQYGIEEYIFMTALLFIITHLFKKGIDLQNENDLTV